MQNDNIVNVWSCAEALYRCLGRFAWLAVMTRAKRIMLQWMLVFAGMMALPALADVDVLIPTMSNSPNPVIRGGDVTYSITVNNDGSDAAANVQVRIDIPAGTQNPRVSLGGDPAACVLDAGGTFALCTLASLAARSSVVAQLVVAADASTPETITIGASVSAANESPNTGTNNALSRNTTVRDGADIYLGSVTGSPNPVVGGGNITWSLAGGNNGPSDATNPRIVLTLPGSLEFVSGSGDGFDCSANGQEVTCVRSAAMPVNGSFSGLSLVTKVLDVNSGNVVITPRISSSLDDPDVNNNQLPASPPVVINAGADLQITQTSPTSVAVSEQEVTFNLAATNNGPSDASNGVTVTYTLPAGFDLVSAIPTGPDWQACTTAGSAATGIIITCNNSGNFEAGRDDPIEIKVSAPEATTQITSYNLTAAIAHNPGNPEDPVAANNQSVLPLQVGPDGAGLSISKTRSPNPVAEGQNINNVLRVGNQGPLDVAAGSVRVTDTIVLNDEEFVSYSGTGWTCDNVTTGNNLNSTVPAVTCTYNQAMAVGGISEPLTIVTKSKVKGSAYTSTNNAEVECAVGAKCWYPVKTISADASVTQTTNSVDLSIEKSVTTSGGENATLEANESTMRYTLVVRNNTPAVDAQDIVVRDPIPGWLTGAGLPLDNVVSVSTANGSDATFTCVIIETSVLQCTQAAGTRLVQGDTATFTIAVSRPLAAGNLTNTATVSSTSQGDTNTANNTASVNVRIDPIADVEMVSKIVTPAVAQAGTDVSYVLTFRNNGPSPAQNVSVSDTFVVGAGDPGFTVLAINPVDWTSGAPNCSGLVVGQSYGAGSTATLSCQGGALNSGEQRTISILVRPNWKTGQAAGQTWTIGNTARIATTTAENVDGSDGGNNSKSATLTVDAADIDLQVGISDNVDPLGYDASNDGDNPQNDVIYAIRLHNNGPSLATGVSFTYALTPKTGKTLKFMGDSPVSGPPSGSVCNNVGQVVTGPNTLLITCTYVGEAARLANGVDRYRYLSVRMLSQPDASGDVHDSQVSVQANETDRNLLNNTESETTTIRNIPLNNLSLSGRVYIDTNDNGLQDEGENGIGGVTMILDGTDINGNSVRREIQTAPDGSYSFTGLPPSSAAGYTITQVQPAGYADGQDTVGSLGAQGTAPGTVLPAGTDSFTVVLTNQSGTGYNFGEIPQGILGSISGHVWLDGDHDRQFSSISPSAADRPQPNWDVELWRNGTRVAVTKTDANGAYVFSNLPLGSGYQVRFLNPNGQLAGHARPNERGLAYENGQVSPANPGGASNLDGGLSNITLTAANPNLTEHSLPLDPAGVVYDAVTRMPVAGAVVTIRGPAGFTPATDLVGGSSSQTTGADGAYQFLLNPSAPAGTYTLEITSYPGGYIQQPSSIIPVCQTTLTVASVTAGGADPAMVQPNDGAPQGDTLHDPATCPSSTADGSFVNGSPTLGGAATRYYTSFNFGPDSGDVINNHIPIDPHTSGLIRIVKTTPLVNVVRGDLVPYTITATSSVDLQDVDIADRLPPGFKYRSGSASANGVRIEPDISGRDITWKHQNLIANKPSVYKLILVVGTGVGEGEYVNQAWAQNAGGTLSNVGSATVKVTPDPTFDCSDIIGKVFDDKNANGYQDQGEPGIPNVRVVTARGLLVTTDAEGRFHVTCADIPNMDRGANFVMKLDERTLPSGYRVTTENPRDVRVTRGKMVKLNFGATVHRVVRLDLNAEAFIPNSTELQPQWQQAFFDMVKQLDGRPSVLRVAYDPGGGEEKLARKRLDGIAKAVRKRWKDTHDNNQHEAAFPLIIETALEGQP